MDQHYDGAGWDQLQHEHEEPDHQHEQQTLVHVQDDSQERQQHSQELLEHEQGRQHPHGQQLEHDETEQYHEAVPGKPQTTKRAREAGEARRKVDPRSHNLAGHLRSHSGAQPYRCEVCNRGFGRQHDCKRHEKLHLTGGSSKKLVVVESLSHTPRKDPTPSHDSQNEAAFASFMGGDDFASGSASLHDLALILGEGSYMFADPPSQVETEPAGAPLTEEEGRANIQIAIHEYARAFPYVHGTPSTKPPPPYPPLVSPFDQALSPPEVLVWLSHCPYPDMAKDTENLRLFVRLMGWMDDKPHSPPTGPSSAPAAATPTTPSSGTKRKSPDNDDHVQPTPRRVAQERAMDELVDPGLFSDEHAHGQVHLDFSSLPEPAADDRPADQHGDHGEFGVPSGDLLHAFPLPDELNQPEDDSSAYPHMPEGVAPPPPPPMLDQNDFEAALASAAAMPLDGERQPLDAGDAELPKPKPMLRTCPRKKRSKPTVPAAHPCEYVDSETGQRCGKVFARTFDLKRHTETVHVPKSQSSYACEKCTKTFSRADALVRHRKVYCQRRAARVDASAHPQDYTPPSHPGDALLYLPSAPTAYEGGFEAPNQYGDTALHYHPDDLSNGDLRSQH